MDIAVSGTLEFDPERLAGFVADRLGVGGPMRLERIGGGQSNPTFFLDAGERRMVLRKQPPGDILKGAHAVDREYTVMEALSQTDVPVPEMILFHGEPDVVGTPFYLMERLEGRVFHDAAMAGLTPQDRRAAYLAMADTLAALHAVDPDAVGLGDYGRKTGYFKRQLARWSRQWRQSPTSDIPELDELAAYLEANLPPDDGRVAIAHGDFRVGNLMYHRSEPKVVAVLDWELSTLGHPLADLGFCCMAWRTTPQEYGGIRGLDHAALGIPSKDEFVARYFEKAGDTPPLMAFHEAFALFRFAVIFVGIADRARAGNASGEEAATLAPLARGFALRGLEIVS
ncbi:phosphotransferase family protein [Jiella mangrovi]|uniref:Phosphotransferase family protein n=1 Tax=Jiella mangrovi TaxID=2821407 RepID=A0ABS4BH18_9HYPH|nr:phosphotransferase family protein [Jiella mangrovi]MBP0616045.1 phosphotransferase family protein [Jiella mangrovi]